MNISILSYLTNSINPLGWPAILLVSTALLSACGGSSRTALAPPSPSTPLALPNQPTAEVSDLSTYNLIPLPASLVPKSGRFALTPRVRVLVPAGAEGGVLGVADRLALLLRQATSFVIPREVATPSGADGDIELRIDSSVEHAEGYRLEVSQRSVTIGARTAQGLFYGVETLRQLASAVLEDPRRAPHSDVWFPSVQIEDAPRFAYRGMHLDVARHFFPVSFVKKYIDTIARYKFNTLHWHLTDDQGWRIEIKQYPKLTEVGAFRKETLIGHVREEPYRFDGTRYGGFYTQDEIRDVVRYAEERFVTLIPEIELPGHAEAALAAYPELACTHGPFETERLWGIFEDIFCPKEETFRFLENVLGEVVELFPSRLIHIGGDEVPKARWQKSQVAKDLMRREKLKSEAELQSYFIRRIGAFLKTKGRSLAGWDEIAEGGIPEGATVMAWRDRANGLAAAKLGHDVIMAPESDLYFNKYQDDDVAREPLAFGGYIPVEKVYAFEPVPDNTEPATAARILGAEGALWTEYVKTPELADYMLYPRALALAEVLWSPKALRSFEGFVRRLPATLERLDALGIPYGRHVFKVKQATEIDEQGRYFVKLRTYNDDDVHFTLDGSDPAPSSPRYQAPILLERGATVRAVAFKDGKALSAPVTASYVVNFATGKRARYKAPFSEKYAALREFALTNGRKGSETFGDGEWQGFDGVDLEVTLDLGTPRAMSRIAATFLRDQAVWIFLPKDVSFEVSLDGERFESVGKLTTTENPRDPKPLIKDYVATPRALTGRYVRIKARNFGKLPVWHGGRGHPSWLFISEIEVE